MTRFMMTLESAVELVLFAFKNGNNGDIFVQKSPATTIANLANAIKNIYNSSSPIKVIGTRHGEKLYETLVNREEMVKAIDEGHYYRILADTRDLNYNKFFTEGEKEVSTSMEYNSHNTKQLNLDETVNLLMTLPFIRKDILEEDHEFSYEP
jgi:UDP-N-acetylglucosamine 4,6-dehydratase